MKKYRLHILKEIRLIQKPADGIGPMTKEISEAKKKELQERVIEACDNDKSHTTKLTKAQNS